MRMFIGFFLGLMVAAALAEEGAVSKYGPSPLLDLNSPGAVFMVGSNPDKHPSVINVDKDGYVICSTEKPK